MATPMKTPGVYIQEKNAFPNSLVEVETAVPAFIGYSQRAEYKGSSLLHKPKEISSLNEFHEFFGFAPQPMFKMKTEDDGDSETRRLALLATEATDKATAAAIAITDQSDQAAATESATAARASIAKSLDSEKEQAGADAAKDASDEAVKKAAEARTAAERISVESDKKVALEAVDAAQQAAASAAQVVALAPGENVAGLLAATVDSLPVKAAVTFNKISHNFEQTAGYFLLYYSMRMFFANGGGKCFIVSVGDYEDEITRDGLFSGIDPLVKEQGPTMVVVPDAVRLNQADCIAMQQKMLSHCVRMANRMAILDIWKGWAELGDGVVNDFRDDLGTDGLKYGAAYYPWLETTVVSERDLGIEHIENKADLIAALKREAAVDQKTLDEIAGISYSATQLQEISEGLTDKHIGMQEQLSTLNDTVRAQSNLYKTIIGEFADRLNLLPPSATMAGIYTRVDTQRGVWKAPANVSVSMVNRPAVSITHYDQENLNVTPQGKSINAIREFVGEGVLVWGARTLDGNSLDWRYINVRRTLIMLEESTRLAAKAFVFEPNTANTWITMKSMITNFLTGIWKRGGLAGASPEDAFSVHVGLGETMTPEDILEGIMRITVLVAPTRPAEFIEITFQQQAQKS